jgi:catechol O-methyltransferase
MAVQLPKDAHIISIEADAESADIARVIHQYAGVENRITIVNGDTKKVIPRLGETSRGDSFDFIFIDHSNNLYLRDLKMLEALNLIQSGTVVVADDVVYPGARDYLEYVRNNPNYKNTFHEAKLEYTADVRNGVEVSIRT